jgi:zinc protease
MFKLRNFSMRWRRYRFGMLFFGVCLSALLTTSIVSSTAQPAVVVAAESPVSTQTIAKQPPAATTSVTPPTSLAANVKKTILPNGLTILSKEVHSAPVVTVQVWYKIGSRNEAPGVNGIAHQLEHMLFKGTKERPVPFGQLLDALGSKYNGATSSDWTAYYGTAEKNRLTSLLTLEADRMQNATFDAKQLTSEKRVVISELQNHENRPSYRLDRAVQRAAFPNDPYGLPVAGTKADVEKFTLEQVRSYYDAYYAPNNATLVVVGDFDTATLMAKVKETFGKVPRREVKVAKPAVTAPIAPKRRLTLREPGANKIALAIYPLPEVNHPDVPAIAVMNYILTAGSSSRMYKSIVETGIAAGLSGRATNVAAGGWYEITGVVEPSKSLPKLEAAIDREIELLQAKGAAPAELTRAKAQLKSTYLLSIRSIGKQAEQLGEDQTTAGDYRFYDKYIAGVERVTAADVQRVAKKYLQANLKTIGYFEPTTITGKAKDTLADSDNRTTPAENLNPGAPLDAAQIAKYLPPLDPDTTSQQQSLPQEVKLANGLRVFLLPDASTPTITLGGNIQAGSEYEPLPKAGAASLTAANLMSGTKTKSALELANALESRGAKLTFGASRESVNVGGSSLAKDLPTLVQTLADVLQNTNFPQQKFELSRQRALVALKSELDNPSSLAQRKFQQTIYPKDHPYTIFPTSESLSGLTVADLKAFHARHYLPSNTILAIVGDFKVAEIKALLDKTLGKWATTATAVKLNYPALQLPKQQVLVNPTLPGKTQSITLMGNKGISRQDPRYYSALVLNQILGDDTIGSRLGAEIRDRQGLTYGIYSDFAAGKRQGTFSIWMQTAPDDARKAIQSTISLLKSLQTNGVTAAEVANAKRTLVSSYTVGLGSPDKIAGATLKNAVYGLNPDEISEFPKQIKAVTLEQVNKDAKELISPDRFVVITAGPRLK